MYIHVGHEFAKLVSLSQAYAPKGSNYCWLDLNGQSHVMSLVSTHAVKTLYNTNQAYQHLPNHAQLLLH